MATITKIYGKHHIHHKSQHYDKYITCCEGLVFLPFFVSSRFERTIVSS
jgi:hypothetical protein